MVFGGLQKFSLLDYPGYISAVVFTQGCNFRCQFCYNPMLVWPVKKVGKSKYVSLSKGEKRKGHPVYKEDDLFAFLKKRKGKLGAVVISGGEPTLQIDLPVFAKKIKALGYKIKLDTNGSNPLAINKLIQDGLVDYLAMDIKAPAGKYDRLTGVKVDLAKIKKSIKIIRESNLPYEFRTTLAPEFLDAKDIEKIGDMIKGAEKWYLQKMKTNTELVNRKLEKVKPFTKEKLNEMLREGKKHVKICQVR